MPRPQAIISGDVAQFRPQPRNRACFGGHRDRLALRSVGRSHLETERDRTRSLFDTPFDAHLSSTGVISWQRTLFIPILGGAVLAAVGLLFARRIKGQQLADAIEANALYGVRVSFRGSM